MTCKKQAACLPKNDAGQSTDHILDAPLNVDGNNGRLLWLPLATEKLVVLLCQDGSLQHVGKVLKEDSLYMLSALSLCQESLGKGYKDYEFWSSCCWPP